MKQVQVKTSKATIVVVDRRDITIFKDYLLITKDNGAYEKILGRFKNLGELAQLTEEDWKGIVDDYVNQGKPIYMAFVTDTDAYATAKEAGLSLLKANGVVMENDFGEEPVLSDYIFEEHPELVGNPKEYDYEKFESDYKEWQQAQEQVWLNPQVFIKTK